MPPGSLAAQVNELFAVLAPILQETSGTLDRYLHDGLMALFGAPIARPDDPVRAVSCGHSMLDALRGLQERWRAQGKPVWHLGIGINTGVVAAGYVGSEDQLSYTVLGDGVNVVTHLPDHSPTTQVLITAATHDLVKDFFVCDQRSPLRIEGRSAPVEIFAVTGTKADIAPASLAGSGADPDAASHGDGSAAMKMNFRPDDTAHQVVCANCGATNDAQQKFCHLCGMPVF
jgi:adenylate cyclase